ncbi:double-stranded RNA-specific editase B2 [Tachysurus ichikawai]
MHPISCTSSTEVKENWNTGNFEDRTIMPSERPSFFLSESSRSGTGALKRKRPLEEDNNGRVCELRVCCRRSSWSDTPKNAVVQLNELRPGLQYRTVSQTGPVHAPLFSIAVEVNGLTFEGTGPTKKKAKMRAAELALSSFVQFPNAAQAHSAMGGASNPTTDFTSDLSDFPETLFKGFEPDGFRSAKSELLSSALRLRHTLDLMVVQARQGDSHFSTPPPTPEPPPPPPSPVVLLNNLRPGARYVCLCQSARGRRARRCFVMAVLVDGRIFEGTGCSKKLAKRKAALSALQALFNITQAPEARVGMIKRPHLPQERHVQDLAALQLFPSAGTFSEDEGNFWKRQKKSRLYREKTWVSALTDAATDGAFAKKKLVQLYEWPEANSNNNCEAEALTLL